MPPCQRRDVVIGEARAPTVLNRKPRACVVESDADGPAYGRLDECRIEVMAVLPRLSELSLPLIGNFDLVIVGCNDAAVTNPAFESRIARIGQYTRVVGVAPGPSPETAAHAARIGFHGFVAREVAPEAFDRAVRAVLDGELAFPRNAMSE